MKSCDSWKKQRIVSSILMTCDISSQRGRFECMRAVFFTGMTRVDSEAKRLAVKTQRDLDMYARSGLRTLCFAKKVEFKRPVLYKSREQLKSAVFFSEGYRRAGVQGLVCAQTGGAVGHGWERRASDANRRLHREQLHSAGYSLRSLHSYT